MKKHKQVLVSSMLYFIILLIILMTELYYLGAGLAIGLAALGVGLGEGKVATKSLEAMGKNPELSNFFLLLTILGIALVESAAIYGLLIAMNIVSADPSALPAWKAIAAGLSIGLAGFGAWVGEWNLVASAMDAVLRNPAMKGKVMAYMILFVALVESVAIYGFIVALNLLG